MKPRVSFDTDSISDAKRLVRGEHWLLARTKLRARDESHHKAWRVLTMAGGSPGGEIVAIRELMPKAHITAVDRDSECLTRAIDAGADDVIQCADVAECQFVPETKGPNGYSVTSSHYLPPAPLQGHKWDAVHLDLCCSAMSVSRIARVMLSQSLTSRGVLIVTFSVGRDVAEVYEEIDGTWGRSDIQHQLPRNMPKSVRGRVAYIGALSQLHSVMSYQGANMPMCSAFYIKGRNNNGQVGFVQVGRGDFELAVVYPEAARLYDCPQERIESLRRKFAAIKAVITTKARREAPEARRNSLLSDGGASRPSRPGRREMPGLFQIAVDAATSTDADCSALTQGGSYEQTARAGNSQERP
jgi:hypothetical protein